MNPLEKLIEKYPDKEWNWYFISQKYFNYIWAY